MENDSQGNKFELPEIGPKTGLGLMLVGLAALYAFGDEIRYPGCKQHNDNGVQGINPVMRIHPLY